MQIVDALLRKEKSVAVIGLGYVGLPLALAFARKFRVTGFDILPSRVRALQEGLDPNGEVEASDFARRDIRFSADPSDLSAAGFFIVTVPTPIDAYKVPDLEPLFAATRTVANALKPGDYVVFESTVYPGCTEEECLPLLEAGSGLKAFRDFHVGYSPERINPGDRERTVERILKVVSAGDADSLEQIAAVYGTVIQAGIYKAASIRIAEAAKVIENIQRDLNISLMNELAVLFDRMGLDTRSVIETAATKWNFVPYYPGLVGGHCIGVDPYYLIHKALSLGINPQVIRAGRGINDRMPEFIAQKMVRYLVQCGKNPSASRVLVMGLTFKENISDLRNSKVADLIRELRTYSLMVDVVDAQASPEAALGEYGMTLLPEPDPPYDAVIVAVRHRPYTLLNAEWFCGIMRDHPILFDLMGSFDPATMQGKLEFWRL